MPVKSPCRAYFLGAKYVALYIEVGILMMVQMYSTKYGKVYLLHHAINNKMWHAYKWLSGWREGEQRVLNLFKRNSVFDPI